MRTAKDIAALLPELEYRIAGPILVKMFHNRRIVSNNDGFIAGIREEGLIQMIGKGAKVRWIIDYRK